MSPQDRIKRLKFRAWHRGTKEADLMIGGYFDQYHSNWGETEIAWFENLMDEEDVDIMAWAIGVTPAPSQYHGEMLRLMQRLDYIRT